jgi:hypothetical protein
VQKKEFFLFSMADLLVGLDEGNAVVSFWCFSGSKKRLFSENPEQDRQHHGNEDARGQGKVKREISKLEDEITGQPAQRHFLQQWPAQAKDNEANADDD